MYRDRINRKSWENNKCRSCKWDGVYEKHGICTTGEICGKERQFLRSEVCRKSPAYLFIFVKVKFIIIK